MFLVFLQKINARDNVECTFPLAEVEWKVPPNTEILKGANQYRFETTAKTSLYAAISCYGFTIKHQQTPNPKVDLPDLLVSLKLASSHFGGAESKEGGDICNLEQWYDGLGLYTNPISFVKLLRKQAFKDYVQMVKEQLAISRQSKILGKISTLAVAPHPFEDPAFNTSQYFEAGGTIKPGNKPVKRKQTAASLTKSPRTKKGKRQIKNKTKRRITSDDEEEAETDAFIIDETEEREEVEEEEEEEGGATGEDDSGSSVREEGDEEGIEETESGEGNPETAASGSGNKNS